MSTQLLGTLLRALAILSLSSELVVAQPAVSISWPMLVDAEAQAYEDPYRDLTPSQMAKLMSLARLQQQLASSALSPEDIEDHQRRAAVIEEDFRAEGLAAGWILAQREAVAARRHRAAVATNDQYAGREVELSGHFLHATSLDSGESVAYLIPDRGFCMHLPAPPPNQVIRLVVEKMPDPIGPCIAAAVRGRLSVEELQHTIPTADGATLIWSRWKLDAREVTTQGSLPAQSTIQDR